MRYLLIATRLASSITLPPPTPGAALTVSAFIGVINGFCEIAAGHRDKSDFQHTASELSSDNLRRIRMTPKSGGNRTSWKDDESLQIKAYKGRDDIFRDVYARMYWNRQRLPLPRVSIASQTGGSAILRKIGPFRFEREPHSRHFQRISYFMVRT